MSHGKLTAEHEACLEEGESACLSLLDQLTGMNNVPTKIESL